MRRMNPGGGTVLKKVSLDWWAVIASLVAVALVKTAHLTVGW
jgi:hypothetical protein